MLDRAAASRDPYAYLRALADGATAQQGGENFPVSLRVLPRRPRELLGRLYAYARFVDDVGDEAAGDRMQLLDLVEKAVRELPDGSGRLPVVAALRPLVTGCHVPLDPLLDLVEANRVDQSVTSYSSFEDLLGYCRLSAAPVGRIVLYIAGAADGANLGAADQVCAGLQVLEHCQDVGEDARAGRVYLPALELARAGVGEEQLHAGSTSPALREVIAVQVTRAVDLLRPGAGLVARLHGWARVAVAGYVAGGLATADALHRCGYDVLSRPVRPSRARTVWHAARLVAGRPLAGRPV
ncbi:MAG: squalene synthase HpnC [Jatrophihabitantaceae bacterium]